MAARASLREARLETGVVFAFVVLIATFLLGGTGGYLARGWTVPTSSTVPSTSHRPFVVEQAPYSLPSPTAVSEPTRDPNGFAVPI